MRINNNTISKDKNLSKLIQALFMLALSMAIGMTGFVFFEDYGFVDAFYTTVITISTVGFETLSPLSKGGKIFVSVYIIFNLGIFAYVISIFTTYLFEGELRLLFRNFIQGREVKQLKNHTIICGFGRNGFKACEELTKENREFVIIENNEDALQHYHKLQTWQNLIGDATEDEVLKSAGISKASSIITTLPNDANNVFITLTAKELNPNINIIARASDENSEKKLLRAGANHVVMPDALGGLHMAQLITKPHVIQFLELLSGVGRKKMLLDEISFYQLKSKYQKKTLAELDIRKNTGVTVLGLKEKGGGFLMNPNATTIVKEDMILIILGSSNDINAFKNQYSA